VAGLSSLVGADAEILADTRFQLLLLANVFPALGTALLSPVLDSLTGPFGVSAADVGLMISAFTAPAVVMIPVTGVVADRRGRKPVLVGGLVVFGATGSAVALTTDFRVALGLRLLQGIGFAALTPIIITSLGDIYAGSREATAQGLRFTGSGIAQTGFPLLAGVLVGIAWQYPFLLFGLALPAAVVVQLYLTEPAAVATEGEGDSTPDTDLDSGSTPDSNSDTDSNSNPNSDPDSDPNSGSGAGSGDDVAPDGSVRALAAHVRHPRVFALVIGRGLPIVAWIGFLTYNSIVVVRLLDGTPALAGGLAALASLAYAASASQAGRLTALFESRFAPLAAATVALGAGFAGLFAVERFAAAVAAVVLMGAGFGVALSLYRSVITGLAPTALRGGLVSLAEGFGRLVATVTPAAMGVAIAVAAPQVGFAAAVRATGLGAAAVATGGGLACLLVARAAPAAEASD